MLWILIIAALALAVLVAFVVLVAGVHGTDRHLALRDADDTHASRAFARRVLGVHVRQPQVPAAGEGVRK